MLESVRDRREDPRLRVAAEDYALLPLALCALLPLGDEEEHAGRIDGNSFRILQLVDEDAGGAIRRNLQDLTGIGLGEQQGAMLIEDEILRGLEAVDKDLEGSRGLYRQIGGEGH